MATQAAVEAALKTVRDPESNQDVLAAGLIRGLVIRDGHVGFSLEVPPARGERAEPLRRACESAVLKVAGVRSVTAVLTAHRQSAAPGAPHPHAPAAKLDLAGIGAIIAVASGKGGVGKSTVAVNLAVALHKLGQRVGLLDADIYGPSVPRLLALSDKPKTHGKKLVPMEAHGLKAMSIGLIVAEDTAMIWRGPMVVSALTQMLNEVAWGELDILVVDMPPGTGDAQLTMAQRVPLAGAVVVSTPQDIALIDARRAVAMFQKTEVPVLGIVENMSLFVCPHCGEASPIFGHGGARATADRLGIPFLGDVPLVPLIRETSDDGTPITALQPESAEAKLFGEIARGVVTRLAQTRRPPPRLIVE